MPSRQTSIYYRGHRKEENKNSVCCFAFPSNGQPAAGPARGLWGDPLRGHSSGSAWSPLRCAWCDAGAGRGETHKTDKNICCSGGRWARPAGLQPSPANHVASGLEEFGAKRPPPKWGRAGPNPGAALQLREGAAAL